MDKAQLTAIILGTLIEQRAPLKMTAFYQARAERNTIVPRLKDEVADALIDEAASMAEKIADRFPGPEEIARIVGGE